MLLNSQWLTYATGPYKGIDDKYGNPSPYFRKTFEINKKVKTATLKIAVIGVFKAYINGQEVSDEYLSPPWVDFTKKIPLLEYDITDKTEGKNAIAVVLGDGWAIGHVGSTATFKRTSFNDTLWFSAEIHIEYTDGSREIIKTDDTWKASSGEILYNDIYMGEYIDHNKSHNGVSRYDFDDSTWDKPTVDTFRFTYSLYLAKVDIPPIRTKHIFKPSPMGKVSAKLTEGEAPLVKGETGHDSGEGIPLKVCQSKRVLYDIGQNIAGVLRCTIKGNKGTKVIARHAEILLDGKLYTDNLRKAEAMDTFVLCGDENGEEFRPIFTYHGFRYFELEIIGSAEIIAVQAEAMYTDLPVAGEFECSSELVNKIYQNTLWSQRDNFYGVPTDCPQRDERLGWTGDAQIFCQSAMYNMDCSKFFAKYLADMRDAQLGNGVIPVVAPLPKIGFKTYSGYDAAAGWSEAIAIIPYLHYKMYGDKQIIKDNIFACKQLLKYYEEESDNLVRDGRQARYGDWLNVDAVTDLDVVAILYFAYASLLTAKMCKIINDDDAEYYFNLYDRIKAVFSDKFILPNNTILSDTQSSYILAYKFGLVDDEFAKTNLERKLKEDNGHLTSGFLGIKYLLPALCDLGLCDNAYDILTQTTYPGWGYSILNGATTIWEHWDSNSTEQLKEMNSFNHYSLGSCVEWMYEYCLGIRPNEEKGGFKKLTLMPYIDLSGKITSARGSYITPYGKIEIEWHRDGEGYSYNATVPSEIEPEFIFPRLNKLQATTMPSPKSLPCQRVRSVVNDSPGDCQSRAGTDSQGDGDRVSGGGIPCSLQLVASTNEGEEIHSPQTYHFKLLP